MAELIRNLWSTPKPEVLDIGHCIYCRDYNTDNLSREHVMPFGLGGGIILRNASCGEHRRITNEEIETPLLSKMFGRVRHLHGMPTYKKKKRPTHFPAVIDDGKTLQKRMLALSDSPDALSLPEFENVPTMITGGGPVPVQCARVRHFHNSERNRELLERMGAKRIIYDAHVDVPTFARLLAKIAHGVAYAEFRANFVPFLLDLFEGRGIEGA